MELVAHTSRSAVPIPNHGDEILQNAINSFRQVLTPEQLAEFNNIQSLPDTDAVLVFTAELDLRRQSQKGKSIASRLFPVLQAVHSFTGVLDTFVSSNPIIAALVWGSVKMTIQIMLNAASYYEAFAELFMNLGTICPRFEQYQALFPTSTRLQVALCNFNASIIRCCQRVIEMPKSSSGWSSPLNPLSPSFWQSFQQSFESNLKELRDHSKNVKEEIRLAQAESEHRSRELQRMENRQAERSRRSLTRFMSRTDTQFDKLQLIRDKELERQRKQSLLDSLSSHDYMKPFKQARQKRYPQSARWIFDTNEFREWAAEKTSPLLWCSGKMGSGKTILAASVIDFLLAKRSKNKGKVTFFFPRFDHSVSLKAETALRAIARQIIDIEDISGDTRMALEEIQDTNGHVLTKLTQLLGSLLVWKRQLAWIVIDGIDEWPRDERRKLIEALSSMLSAGPEVKVFVTSRDHADDMTEEAFPVLHQVSMNCLEARRDMTQLVTQAVQNCLDAEELLVKDEKLIADIKKTLTDNADGMILWVTLVLRELCVQPSDEMIRDVMSLQKLPKGLAEVFNHALKRIISNGKENITQAILPWIVAAKQPLSLRQLEECCLIRVLQEYSMKERCVNGIHLVDCWFQGLIEVDHETKTVHFIHSSVQRFLLKAPANPDLNGFYVSMEQADRHIGEVIVTYLNFDDFKNTLAKRRPALPPISPKDVLQQALGNEFGRRKFLLSGRGTRTANIDGTIATCTQPSRATLQETMDMDHPFLSYASTYWLLHSFNFDHKNCRVWNIWKNMIINGHELAASPVPETQRQIKDEAITRRAFSTGNSTFHYIAATSSDLLDRFHIRLFDYVLRENNVELLSLMLKTKTWNSELLDPLCRAARSGLLEVLKALVDAGADLNVEQNPIIEAIVAGQVGAVEILLASGANPNLPIRYQKNALELAVDLGGSKGIQVCQMLIKAGADLYEVKRFGLTALQRACKTGQEEIVDLLLTAGVKANDYVRDVHSSPLDLAIEYEHIRVIRLLLKFGTDVNRENSSETTPLVRACSLESSRLDIAELLIKAGAKMNEVQSYKLLQQAVEQRSGELVKLLIQKGASVNMDLEKADASPLALAAKQGLFEIMHSLLDSGAIVEHSEDILSWIPPDLQNGDEYEDISRRLRITP